MNIFRKIKDWYTSRKVRRVRRVVSATADTAAGGVGFVLRTGAKVAGFKDEATGKFEDLMLIRRDEDLREFMTLYHVKEEEIRKEW